ncbi:trypsin-like serine peptidase [Streptomyces luteolus]|uniref:Peptidase n=1 Tax=Streptomyces luteolus TaxID=3043615 RepID=A0ABT6T7H1_9ACTN|nr:peptidase [Streptomyces sp. B-S-A12]MDI3423325.1 peptidase [Streptomyces sp. B-S-A12]
MRRRSLRIPHRALSAATATGALVAGLLLQTGSASATPSVEDFWTAERMRAAEPLDVLPVSPGDLNKVKEGVEKLVPPTGLPGAEAFPETGGPWTGGGKVTSTAGRVFFTYQGRQASCSGNAVTSANKSTVLTAGHCVKMDGAWHTNWVFVPEYKDGQAPHGKWTAAKTLSTPQWTATEDINYDVGAAVVNPLDGKKLTDVVGAQGVAFNTGYNKKMYAFGYPAADPYDGSKLIHCSGNSIQDPLLSTDHGLSCDMTGGSSGGPWFQDFDEASGTGLQNSVNSFGYTFLPGYMFGPYFGDDAKNLYEKAQTS